MFIGKSNYNNGLKKLTIYCNDNNKNLNENTLTNYSIIINKDEGSIYSSTPFGAIYGIETFSQLINDYKLDGENINIYDEPVYNHRGIMIDTGRRYWPIKTV